MKHTVPQVQLLRGDDESKFVRIHNNDYVQGKKRLYMTFSSYLWWYSRRTEGVTFAQMDDKSLYGGAVYVIHSRKQ